MTTREQADAAARGWAAELSSGSTRTWAAYRSAPGPAVPPAAGPVPGAAQLELLRLLALDHASRPLPAFDVLAARVLASSGPGRGLVDPPLPWPGGERGYGAPPVEPDLLPAGELVRAACGVLVPLLLEAGGELPETRPDWKRLLPGRRRFSLGGTPLTVAAVRAALLADGWIEGGPRAVHLVLGRDVDRMMAEHWVASVRRGSEKRWLPLWRGAADRDRLPRRLRLDEVATRRAEQQRAARVELVLGRDEDELAAGVGAALGTRLELPPVVVDGEFADLLRRLNPFLVLAGGREARDRAVAGPLTAALRSLDRAPSPLVAPEEREEWARRAALALGERIGSGDYAVHGPVTALVPERDASASRSVETGNVVGLAVGLIGGLWRDAGTEGRR